MDAPPPEIFDRALRRHRRDRAARLTTAAAPFLRERMIEEIFARLDVVRRDFAVALDLGCGDGAVAAALRARGIRTVCADSGFDYARRAGGVQCDEDRLPFADRSFDLVIAAGGLEHVNDLPGALTLIRRVLKTDGLFLGAITGAGTLPRLRDALLAADMAEGGATPRIHPQIDVRAAGDLLARAGFALPVADAEKVRVRYRDPLRLIADIRAEGAGNLLVTTHGTPLTRGRVARVIGALIDQSDGEGRFEEWAEIITLTGWAPPEGPRPAPGPRRRIGAPV